MLSYVQETGDEKGSGRFSGEMGKIYLQGMLGRVFGFERFRPGQERVVGALLGDPPGSALAVFPTGGGKSLTYQLPALVLGEAGEGVTVVISPLISLMKDQISFLRSRKVAAARLDSSLSREESREVEASLQDGSLRLLYVSPERFNNERFLALLGRARISLFAIDEAHCISEWGHAFRPDYLKLAETTRMLKAPRVLALTGTATPPVVHDVCEAFHIPPENAVVTGFYRPNLNLLTTPVTADERDDVLLARFQNPKRPPGPTIVYVTLQRTAERVARMLADAGHEAHAYHAGMKPEERATVQEAWTASDQWIVVATIAFGMGIDKADVRYVYHYNLPKSLESYSQEIGRAGRDGEPSVVELLACPDDVPTLENFAYGDTPTEMAHRSLVLELLGLGPEFSVSLYDLSARHDVRQIVLKTALTYLELDGILKQGTPYYDGYEFRPLAGGGSEAVAAAIPGEPGEFVAGLFRVAKKGSVWYSLSPDEAAVSLGHGRERVVRALEYLDGRGLIELKTSRVRHRFSRLRAEEDAEALVAGLTRRFNVREEGEISRLGRVLTLIEHEGCQVNALASYFGETRPAPCDHCTFCRSGQARKLPTSTVAPTESDFSKLWPEFAGLRRAYPEALGEPRQAVRFLCGISSPATTYARLSRHPLFGALAAHRFADVLARCPK
jgi:ATP-dependent DNA helicase RecQ